MNTAFWKETLPAKLDFIIGRLIIYFLLLILLICTYYAYDAWYVFYSDKNSMDEFRPVAGDVSGLRELSGDAVAWIYMHDTDLDFPIVQGDDNIEYLNKAPDGSYSLAGSVFLDERNSRDFKDDYNLTYGHYGENYKMFGVLDHWTDRKYFDSHRKGTLWLADGRKLKVEAFALVYTDSGVEEVFNAGEQYDRIGYLRQNAEYFAEPETEHILALSTCKQANTTSRTALMLAITNDNEEHKND